MRQKKKLMLELAIVISLIFLVNVLGKFWFKRLDLTQEKRFTLSKSTKKLLSSLEDDVYIDVYLDGNNLPAGIKKLRNSTKDILNEFKAHSKGKVHFYFENLDKIDDEQERLARQNELVEIGLPAINLGSETKTEYTEKLIFPGAVLSNNMGVQLPVQILENQMANFDMFSDQPAYSNEEIMNNSFNFLEYKFANTIHKLKQSEPFRIGLLQGHGELEPMQMASLIQALALQNFKVQRLDLSKDRLLDSEIDIVLVAKPNESFSENDKFKIDQFVMNGGKMLWMIDKAIADLDSLGLAGGFVSVERQLEIDDLLFRYGIRLPNEIVQDLYCNPIPLVAEAGRSKQTNLYPWVYSPRVTSYEKHPIVKNIGAVALTFSGWIDLLDPPEIEHQVLLSTSEFSRALATPHTIQLEAAKLKPLPEYFSRKYLPVAVLTNGNFKSHFQNRATKEQKELLSSSGLSFKSESNENRMIFISDGDIGRNELESNGMPLPLGYYKYTQENFSNQDFLINCIEFLVDDQGLIDARNKETKMGLLDKGKLTDAKAFWQWVNILLPLIILFIMSVLFNSWRKRKYVKAYEL